MLSVGSKTFLLCRKVKRLESKEALVGCLAFDNYYEQELVLVENIRIAY